MKILSAAQIRKADASTIEREGITSLDLMERAAEQLAKAIQQDYPVEGNYFSIFCGSGNNGGDGWALARMLHQNQYRVSVFDCQIGTPSADQAANRIKFQQLAPEQITVLRSGDPIQLPPGTTHLIDALFGVGLNRPISGYWATVIDAINAQALPVISIDVPSGLVADGPSAGHIIKAQSTLTFQAPKLAFFASNSYPHLDHWRVLDIGLDKGFVEAVDAPYSWLTATTVKPYLRTRHRFDHKGTFGHVLVVAGSHGMLGAAVLSARAALRTGAGLVSLHVPRCGYEVVQISFPEAMCKVDRHRFVFSQVGPLAAYRSLAVGPGLGTNALTVQGVQDLLKRAEHPIVVDADALNIISKHPALFSDLPPNSILTPHPKEFERLFGKTENEFARWELQRQKAAELKVIIVLKTAYTSIATPDGQLSFNSTGNPGMGTAGTGDVLTGMLTSLLAQGYLPAHAAKLGVYLHGLAGDLAAEKTEQESLIATDLIQQIGSAFSRMRQS